MKSTTANMNKSETVIIATSSSSAKCSGSKVISCGGHASSILNKSNLMADKTNLVAVDYQLK